MSTWCRFDRWVRAGILVAIVLSLGAGSAVAQGMYYKEVVKDGRVYVFNDAKNAAAFEKTGEIGKSISRPGAGANGETIVADSEKALQLYFFKHNISEPVPEPPPPAPAAPPYKFSGLMFGDYYYFKSDNQSAFDTQQGFWLRRVYFTYDHTFTSAISTRFRLEANSNGKMTTPATSITPYVKDAWVRWAYSGKHAMQLGILPTTTFEFVEGFYGLRHIEKTPVDLYKIDSSRDFGVSLSGPIDAANHFQYAFQFGNDSGNNSETDKYKAVRMAVRYVTNPGLVAEGFYSYHWRALDANRFIGQFFVGYQTPTAKAGFQYTHQTRHPANNLSGGADTTINVWSGFVNYFAKPNKVTLFARMDSSDANPDALGIDYLPIYNKAPFKLGIVGAEFYLHPSVRFSPNVEWVTYGDPVAGAAAPARNDTVLRCTFYWTW